MRDHPLDNIKGDIARGVRAGALTVRAARGAASPGPAACGGR
ncbi:hypothetical protein SXCC_03036 [Gluconacetobacter sp. SXCC-1]|nr:hypothetical protein SXCC_03036 [Gluconacetobacter sp. SXCC-1]